MLIDTDDIITSSEIAELLGVKASAVSNWKKRHEDFPKPFFAQIGYGGVEYSLYLRPQVIAWYKERYGVGQVAEQIERLQRLKEELERSDNNVESASADPQPAEH